MKITRLYVSGYKNLSNCEIRPHGFHAITGCNSCGKSNFLEVLPFVANFLSVPGKQRKNILENGQAPNGMIWHPFVKNPKYLEPFVFEIDAELTPIDEKSIISYRLEFEKPKQKKDGSMYAVVGPGRVKSEKIYMKRVGKPGPKRLILSRNAEGNTAVGSELEQRRKINFKTKTDSSALQALEVREANSFLDTFPVLSNFYYGLTECGIIRIDPVEMASSSSSPSSISGNVLESFDIIQALEKIEEEGLKSEFLFWANRLCDIIDVEVSEDPAKKFKFVFVTQRNFIHIPQELSVGTNFILGILLAIYAFYPFLGPIIIEEPESHTHPKAIIDLIGFLRTISEDNTVLISTHSPVVINSLDPKEVTLIKPTDIGLATTVSISDSKEAIDSLERGFMSFGDLLQSNFLIDDIDE